jgi:hypothetical protein
VLSARLAAVLRGLPEATSAEQRERAGPREGMQPPTPTEPKGATPSAATRYRLRFRADAAQLFRALPALQNLADNAVYFTASIDVEVEGKEPFDQTWLRNAVGEHLDEAGVDAETTLE